MVELVDMIVVSRQGRKAKVLPRGGEDILWRILGYARLQQKRKKSGKRAGGGTQGDFRTGFKEDRGVSVRFLGVGSWKELS